MNNHQSFVFGRFNSEQSLRITQSWFFCCIGSWWTTWAGGNTESLTRSSNFLFFVTSFLHTHTHTHTHTRRHTHIHVDTHTHTPKRIHTYTHSFLPPISRCGHLTYIHTVTINYLSLADLSKINGLFHWNCCQIRLHIVIIPKFHILEAKFDYLKKENIDSTERK